MAGTIYVGPSGWSYPGWREHVMRGVPLAKRLEHVGRLFDAAEVNGSYYTQIARETYARWAAQTPPHFRFAVKGHRYVTHYKRLAGCGDPVKRLRDQASGLGEKLAVVLWQLPARFSRDDARLDDFLGVLRAWPEARHALELRDASWFVPAVRARLETAGIANCISDAPDFPMWDAVTTDLVYVRLHGHTRKYASHYAPASLRRWAERARRWSRAGRDVHVYLDNDAEGAAVHDALALRELVRAARPRRATRSPSRRR